MSKGSYKEVSGDLITKFKNDEFDVIVHGCNCFNIMGAGIAGSLARIYPGLLEVDKNFCIPVSDYNRLGNYSVMTLKHLETNRLSWIINAYTQYNAGRNLSYGALGMVLKKINFAYQPERVGLPLIGAGIAGGDWNIIKKIIKKELKDCHVTVCFLDNAKHLME